MDGIQTQGLVAKTTTRGAGPVPHELMGIGRTGSPGGMVTKIMKTTMGRGKKDEGTSPEYLTPIGRTAAETVTTIGEMEAVED